MAKILEIFKLTQNPCIFSLDGTRLPVDHRQVAFRNGTLMIRDVQRTQDAGKYRCVVSNSDRRSASRDLEVIVLGE